MWRITEKLRRTKAADWRKWKDGDEEKIKLLNSYFAFVFPS